ncbi:SGNH/GDSL hydrolase family protein [Nocardia sp. NPDC004278]
MKVNSAVLARLLAVVALPTTLVPALAGAAASTPMIRYVALGDSAAAGPLLPNQDTTSPGCLRSHLNYPSVLAAKLGAALTDVSCSSAKSQNVTTTAQSTLAGSVPPQVDSLDAGVDLVTLTIGLNDLNLFTTALACVNPLPEPTGKSCRDKYVTNGVDTMRNAINDWAPTWGRVLDTIRARAPRAHIAVIGYGTYFRPGGCASQPLWPGDADYLGSVVATQNAALAAETQRRGDQFIDIATVSVGHDVCAPSDQAYYTGLIPNAIAVPLHPTTLGMQSIGEYAAQQLQ